MITTNYLEGLSGYLNIIQQDAQIGDGHINLITLL